MTFDSREELFEIPKGTWARRMAGDTRETLPSEIHLVVGIHNVLTLKNSDDVPQIFGPTLAMPGQVFRLPFTRPSENYFNCTAHASGQLVIVVEAAPRWPWSRLSWRGATDAALDVRAVKAIPFRRAVAWGDESFIHSAEFRRSWT